MSFWWRLPGICTILKILVFAKAFSFPDMVHTFINYNNQLFIYICITIFLPNSYPTCISVLLCCCKAKFPFLGITYPPHCSPNHDQSSQNTKQKYNRAHPRPCPAPLGVGGRGLALVRKKTSEMGDEMRSRKPFMHVCHVVHRYIFIVAFTWSRTGGRIMDGVNLCRWRKAATIDPSAQTGDQLSPCNEPIQEERHTHTHTHTHRH